MKNTTPKKKILLLLIVPLFFVFIIYVITKFFPFLSSLKNEQTRLEFQSYISSLKIKGLFIFLIIQILQIIITFIPGQIIELLAGLIYGTWGRLLMCLLGNFIATSLIYFFIKILARNKLTSITAKLNNYSFLNNKNKISLYLFIIFFMPGIPKDIFTYLAPFSPISFWRFILITTLARIPSIVSSTFSSSSFFINNYTSSLIIIISSSLIGLFCLIYKDKIINKLKQNNNKDTADNTRK